MPAVKSIPGRYSPNEYMRKTRFTPVDAESALQIGVEHHGSTEAMERFVTEEGQKRLDSYQRRVAEDCEATSRRLPPTSAPEGRTSDPRRFMAVVRAPWIKRSTNAVEWGFHCVGCKKQHRSRPLHWRRKYCVETFSDHIEECGRIDNYEHRVDGSFTVAE